MDFLDLRKLLGREKLDRCATDTECQDIFEKIADILLNKTAIRKGHKVYYIKDVEFYLYKDCHRDIITYPRMCEAGQWFFHPSGIDISFESYVKTQPNKYGLFQPVLDSRSFFGGVLLRQIYREGTSPEDAKKYRLDGPHRVEWELFDKFDAFNDIKYFPYLMPREDGKNEIKAFARQNLLVAGKTPEQKVGDILNYNYYACEIQRNELVASFSQYKDAQYRFTI